MSLVSCGNTALRTEWSLQPSHTACSHPSLHKPQQCRGAWLQLWDIPGEHGLWAFLLLFGLPWMLIPFASNHWGAARVWVWWNNSSFLKDVISHPYVLWTRDFLVCETHEIQAKQIPRLIHNFNYFRVPFSASIHSCGGKSQILQWQVSSMSVFEGT